MADQKESGLGAENPLKPYQEKIITLMIRQESLLAQLYHVFAQRFPQGRALWERLAKDEEKHAGWLEQLRDAARKKVVLFEEGKVKTYTLETLVRGLEEKVGRAEAGDMDFRQAMASTIDAERALLEKEVFRHFQAMTDKAEKVMKFLAEESRTHLQEAEKMWRELCQDGKCR